MSKEKAPKDSEELRQVLELSGAFLVDEKPHPGHFYQKVPSLIGAILGKPATYKLQEGSISAGRDWWFFVGNSDAPIIRKVQSLYGTAIIRAHRAEYPVGNWAGSVKLSELTPANLMDGQLIPDDNEETLYDLQVHQYSFDGTSVNEYERIIFGVKSGVLAYDISETLGVDAAPPLQKAALYLAKDKK